MVEMSVVSTVVAMVEMLVAELAVVLVGQLDSLALPWAGQWAGL
jgi:hypothetical protein